MHIQRPQQTASRARLALALTLSTVTAVAVAAPLAFQAARVAPTVPVGEVDPAGPTNGTPGYDLDIVFDGSRTDQGGIVDAPGELEGENISGENVGDIRGVDESTVTRRTPATNAEVDVADDGDEDETEVVDEEPVEETTTSTTAEDDESTTTESTEASTTSTTEDEDGGEGTTSTTDPVIDGSSSTTTAPSEVTDAEDGPQT